MPAARTASRLALTAICLLGAAPAHAQDWEPFKDSDERARQEQKARPTKAPRPAPERDFTPGEVTRGSLPPLSASAATVERGDPRPLPASEASGFSAELWQGLDAQGIEAHLARLEVPVRSPTLLSLWTRMWMAPHSPPGQGQAARIAPLRLDTLYRYGLIGSLRTHLGRQESTGGVEASAAEARARIGLGDRERGCARIRSIVRQISELTKLARTDALLISGYCAIVEKNPSAASVAAELARDQNTGASTGLAVLEALAAGGRPEANVPGPMSLLDYRFLELAGIADPAAAVARADGPLLAWLASEPAVDADVRLRALEAAGQPNGFDAELLAEVYAAARFDPAQLADPFNAKVPAHVKRALLYQAAVAERRPEAKARVMQALLEAAREANRLLPTAAALGAATRDLRPAAAPAPFAQAAVETLAAASRYDQARTWADSGNLQHWLALIDIAEPKAPGSRSAHLAPIEQLAARGKLGSDLLHRLATVLDALDVQVPIPLWEAASRAPQPDAGHLPETGVLSQLQEAAKKKEVARTILLAMRAIGPNGAEGAHMIALGDAIRALRRAGLERDARHLGFEALFAAWPRTAGTDR